MLVVFKLGRRKRKGGFLREMRKEFEKEREMWKVFEKEREMWKRIEKEVK